jgi:hypothetical protein
MASDMSNYLGNKLLRWLAGNAMPSAPATVYLALFNGDPQAAGSEITTSVRAAGRLAITWSSLASGTTNTFENNGDIDFGASATGSLSLSHIAIFDASSSGNRLWSKAVTGGPLSVALGANVKVASGDLDLTAGGG